MNWLDWIGIIGSLISSFLLLPDLIYYIKTKSVKHSNLLEMILYWITIFSATGIVIVEFIDGDIIDASIFIVWITICIILSLPIFIANIRLRLKKGEKNV